jgi:putative ABC transport system permease protein
VAARTYVDPLVVGGLLALVLVALAAALLVENLANRQMRLGELLRVGEES